MVHETDREPDVRRVVVGPEEARVGRVRPHDERDLHHPRALREEEEDACTRRPEMVLQINLHRASQERTNDDNRPQSMHLSDHNHNYKV